MSISPQKTNSPLVIDTDTMFSFAITLQRLKPIREWKPKILQPNSRVNCVESHKRSPLNLSRKPLHKFAIENPLSIRVSEGLDHAQ